MKQGNNKIIFYAVLLLIVGAIAYTACKDLSPSQELVEKKIELKLSK